MPSLMTGWLILFVSMLTIKRKVFGNSGGEKEAQYDRLASESDKSNENSADNSLDEDDGEEFLSWEALGSNRVYSDEDALLQPPPVIQDVSGQLLRSRIRTSFAYRIAAISYGVFDFSFFAILSGCFALLKTVKIPGVGDRLLLDGSTKAGVWQLSFLLLLIGTFVIPIVIHILAFVRRRKSTAWETAFNDAEFSPFRSMLFTFCCFFCCCC